MLGGPDDLAGQDRNARQCLLLGHHRLGRRQELKSHPSLCQAPHLLKTTVMSHNWDLHPKIALLNLKTREWHALLEDAADPRYVPTGHVVDGQRFLMVKLGQQEAAPVIEMTLVQNWFEELKRLVPGGK